jgi:hypothetical protein
MLMKKLGTLLRDSKGFDNRLTVISILKGTMEDLKKFCSVFNENKIRDRLGRFCDQKR